MQMSRLRIIQRISMIYKKKLADLLTILKLNILKGIIDNLQTDINTLY